MIDNRKTITSAFSTFTAVPQNNGIRNWYITRTGDSKIICFYFYDSLTFQGVVHLSITELRELENLFASCDYQEALLKAIDNESKKI